MQHLIKDLTILLLVSLPINILFHKIKLPSIMGFLIAGILIGPNGLHWVGDSETVKDLAEIGVILLLFVIGLEFSLRGIIKNLMTVIGVGGIQIALTVLAVFLVCVEMGMPTNQGIAFGLLVALSSTAIVLKNDHRQGRVRYHSWPDLRRRSIVSGPLRRSHDADHTPACAGNRI